MSLGKKNLVQQSHIFRIFVVNKRGCAPVLIRPGMALLVDRYHE
ncbi:MAG: hypothetical protein ALAOOOJD_00238 [bacterium]|nr:hypothetical protein [bacterium]